MYLNMIGSFDFSQGAKEKHKELRESLINVEKTFSEKLGEDFELMCVATHKKSGFGRIPRLIKDSIQLDYLTSPKFLLRMVEEHPELAANIKDENEKLDSAIKTIGEIVSKRRKVLNQNRK